jgi:hypothetical protein
MRLSGRAMVREIEKTISLILPMYDYLGKGI